MASRRLKRRARRLLFALTPLLLALLLFEGLGRWRWEPPEVQHEAGQVLLPHPTRLWALAPGIHQNFGAEQHIDDRGIRRGAGESGPLVLTLGDSSIYGHGLPSEGTLHGQLAELAEERGLTLRALTGAVPGYSSAQTLRWLEELGWGLEPDLIVIGSLWSDNNFAPESDRSQLEELDRWLLRVDRLAHRHSAGWRLLRGVRVGDQSRMPVGWMDQEANPVRGERRVALPDYARNLDRMLEESLARGIGAIFLAPCNRIRGEGRQRLSVWTPYFEAMERVAKHRGVLHIDACELLRESGLALEDSFMDAMHPKESLNRVYAEAILTAVLEAGWPSAPLRPASVQPFEEALVDRWRDRAR